jgi:outer membrane protein assembly factor BamB
MNTILSLLLLFFLFPPFSPEGEAAKVWPGFRGHGDSHSRTTKLPVEWSDKKNLAWDIPLPGYGQSSPVVWRDRVFITAVDGPNKEQAYVLGYDLRSGRELWRRSVATTEKVKVDFRVSQAAPTPVVDRKRVYVFFETGDLYAFDHRGRLQWERKMTREYGGVKGPHGLGSSLAANQEALFLAISHLGTSFVMAIDKKSGRTLWRTDRPSGMSWGTPLVLRHDGREQLVVRGGDGVTAYDVVDGQALWFVTGLKGAPMPSPTHVGDLVIIGAEQKALSMAIRLGGSGDVTATHVVWRPTEATAYFSSPLVHQGLVYFVSKAGIAYCLDLSTGTEVWRQRLGTGESWASPLAVGDRVYFFNNEGKTFVLRTGREFQQLAVNTIPDLERIYGVAAVENALLLRSGRRLIRLSESRGEREIK